MPLFLWRKSRHCRRHLGFGYLPSSLDKYNRAQRKKYGRLRKAERYSTARHQKTEFHFLYPPRTIPSLSTSNHCHRITGHVILKIKFNERPHKRAPKASSPRVVLGARRRISRLGSGATGAFIESYF